MTLKQTKLINGIKDSIKNKDNRTLSDIAKEVGYSISARTIYKHPTKTHIRDALAKLGYSNEELKERFNLIFDLTLKDKDYTNALRSNENIARMQGAFLDKSESKVTVNAEHQQSIDEIFKNRLKDVSPSVQ